MELDEAECTIEHNGAKYTNRGAFVNGEYAQVYIKTNVPPRVGLPIQVTDWTGNVLGSGAVRTVWEGYSRYMESQRYASVRFTIDGVTYAGRLNWDSGELVRGRRVGGAK